MTSPFMTAYAELLVKTCHARGAHAIGGMAAFVPSRANPDATAAALEKTTADKSREAEPGSTAPGLPIRGWCRPVSRRSRPCSATVRTSSSGSARTFRCPRTS